MICFHLVAVAMGFWCKLLNSYLTNNQILKCKMDIVLPSIMSKWPQRIVFTDRLSISAQIALQSIPEDDEKNNSSQFIFFPEILQSWIMIWFVTVSARDLNFAPFTFFPSDKIKGRVMLPNRMNFWKNSKRPSPPPYFWKIMLQFFYDGYGRIYARRHRPDSIS